VQGMEVCNQLGIIARERFRGHGRWWAQSWSSRSNIDCSWCSDSESGAIAMTMAWWAPANRNGHALLDIHNRIYLVYVSFYNWYIQHAAIVYKNTKAWTGIRDSPSKLQIQEQRYSSWYISQSSSQVGVVLTPPEPRKARSSSYSVQMSPALSHCLRLISL
jgi:hypothetical protein